MKKRFLRQDWYRILALGKRRKAKRKWRAPKGVHSKLRKKKKGHAKMPSIGYGKAKKERKKIIIVHNIKELEKVKKDEIAAIASVGLKKKLEIAKKALELGTTMNIDLKKFIEEAEKKLKEKKEEKEEKKKEEEKEKVIKEEGREEGRKEEKKEEEKKEEKMIMKPVEKMEKIKKFQHVKEKEKKLIKRVALEK